MSFKVFNVTKKIPLVIYKKAEKAALSFCRFQEHYESPNKEFRDSYFSFRKFKKWYIKENGSFSYPQDWGGFNFPSHIVENFNKGYFNPLMKREEILLSALNEFKPPYYVIGTFKDGNDDLDLFLKHEISHALFYTSRNYRKNTLDIIHSMPAKTLKALSQCLEYGYGENTIIDEIHAYIATEDFCHFESVDIPKKVAKSLKNNLNQQLEKRKICIHSLVKDIKSS